MGYDIKISKQGLNVLGTASTDPNNLIFDSILNTFKIIKSGTFGVSHGTSAGTTSIAHNQSGVPSVYAFFKFSSGYVGLPNERDKGTVAANDFSSWNLEVDGTNIYFISYNSLTNYTGTASYFVFESPAN